MDTEPVPPVAGGKRRRRTPTRKTNRRHRRSVASKKKTASRSRKTQRRHRRHRRRVHSKNLVGGGAPGAMPTDLSTELAELAGLSADASTRVVGAPSAAVAAANESNQNAMATRPGTVRSA